MTNEPTGKKQPKTFAEKELETLKFWEENKIFEKSLSKESPRGDFIFYDGPPFATGEPHYGHILAGTIKDVIPRFKTMQGYRAPRRWGWDCHGLPVENLIEKELGLKSKKDIEQIGVANFNEAARGSVMRYADIWKRVISRMGRWVDMEDDYKTMDTSYTESIWWAFKKLHERGLIYEGFKSMHLCPRCGTTLSNFEVSQGYKDIKDISVYVKFEAEKGEAGFIKTLPGEQIYLLVWTTTPWTLPGNVALAVNPDLTYAATRFNNNIYVLAKDRLEALSPVLPAGAGLSMQEFSGKKLLGLRYKPVFDYFQNARLPKIENAWKVQEADFVSAADGTGIVHIAPAFGEDDLELARKKELPVVSHVASDGRFTPDVKEFAGLSAKPKGDHTSTDKKIIESLERKNLLLSQKEITHSYPHCWRCDTPLLNYASASWFVKVSAIRDKLIEENKKIHWVPREVGEARFDNWLSGARDWAISRSRYWGAPIPVWKCDSCAKIKIIGGIGEIADVSKPRNEYVAVRHGEAENNAKGILNLDPSVENPLTEKGRSQAVAAGQELKKEKFDLIFCSPFQRTRETAEIIAEEIGFPKDRIAADERLREIVAPLFDGKASSSYAAAATRLQKFEAIPGGGENYSDIQIRAGKFLSDMERRYEGKKILIVSHEATIWLMESASKGYDPTEAAALWKGKDEYVKNAGILRIYFSSIPRNQKYRIDLHRPFIDSVVYPCGCGGQMRRIPEVFDCWFESGSMPFASNHYPFENLDTFDPEARKMLLHSPRGYPADFIAEGLDQTRGWFYSMLVLGTALFGHAPFKNVVVNGLILATDGRKMSKRLANYPEPSLIADKYGADSLRYYLLSSAVVSGEELRFNEKGLDEIQKKLVGRLENVVSFYELYANTQNSLAPRGAGNEQSNNVLDVWIEARLAECIKEVTSGLEKYEINRAARPLADFVDDLSTWYLRRSRDRFKGDNPEDNHFARKTTRNVLLEFSKILAPFMPFLAERVFRSFASHDLARGSESVHLQDWPLAGEISKEQADVLSKMRQVREFVSAGLLLRSNAGMKIRQPLGKMTVNADLSIPYLSLIQDELNVKSASFIGGQEEKTLLDTTLTPELVEEGTVRELLRAIQDLRKRAGLKPGQMVSLIVDTAESGQSVISRNANVIKKVASLEDIAFEPVASVEAVTVGGWDLGLKIKSCSK